MNVVDPSLRDWFLPDFTTTTDNDRVVSSVVLMSTTKHYFSYRVQMLCGLPAVTLLGEKQDWEILLAKIDKLAEYGQETEAFANILRPVLAHFVKSLEDPESSATKDFWQHIALMDGGGSGPSYLTGWITAFCFFHQHGKPLFWKPSDQEATSASSASSKLTRPQPISVKASDRLDPGEAQALHVDGIPFPEIDTAGIPPAFGDVAMKSDDHGQEFDTIMIAGVTGVRVSDSGMSTDTHDEDG
jgi:hypothetical protein